MKTYCLALDLKNDPISVEEYKQYHKRENIWPAVVENIKNTGILSEEIYLIGTRLFMILQTTDDFSFQAKMAADQANPDMQKWEALMWKYQRPLPEALPGEKWVLMEKIFEIR